MISIRGVYAEERGATQSGTVATWGYLVALNPLTLPVPKSLRELLLVEQEGF